MATAQRLQRYFSPILLVFIAVVAALVLAVLYVAFSKTTVTITLREVPEQLAFQYTAAELGLTPTVSDVNATYTFTAYEATSSTDAIARGTVTLTNDYSVDQPLVRTTRLMSDDDVLFHIDESVTVPAGGSIIVPVYADQAGATGNIGPSHFVIVALDKSLQDKIYADSDTDMTGGVIKKVVLTQELIDEAEPLALTAALAEFEQVDLQDLTQTVNGEVGDEVDSVVITTTGTVTSLAVTEAVLIAQLQSEDKPVADDAVVTYEVTADGSELIVSGEAGTVKMVNNLDFVEPASLTGKTEQQVKDYLSQFDQVAGAEVRFVPFWIQRTPELPQQIQLIQK